MDKAIEIVIDGTAAAEWVSDWVRRKAASRGLPATGQGVRHCRSHDAAFFGRREDGRLMLRYERAIPETEAYEERYSSLLGGRAVALVRECVADSLDDLLSDAALGDASTLPSILQEQS